MFVMTRWMGHLVTSEKAVQLSGLHEWDSWATRYRYTPHEHGIGPLQSIYIDAILYSRTVSRSLLQESGWYMTGVAECHPLREGA